MATLLLAPVLALATGGTAGLIGFFTVTIQARSQQLLSYSVWGVPKNLFSRSGLARPVVVSASLQAVVTTALVALVVGLLVLSLRRSDGSALGFWNVTGCVVLLLPVSHSAYAVYLLPLFWIWASRWLAAPRSGLVAVVTALLALWWLALFHKQWDSSLPAGSSLRDAVLFFADLAAVAVSVAGGHLVRVRAGHGRETTTPVPAYRLSVSGRPAPRHAVRPRDDGPSVSPDGRLTGGRRGS